MSIFTDSSYLQVILEFSHIAELICLLFLISQRTMVWELRIYSFRDSVKRVWMILHCEYSWLLQSVPSTGSANHKQWQFDFPSLVQSTVNLRAPLHYFGASDWLPLLFLSLVKERRRPLLLSFLSFYSWERPRNANGHDECHWDTAERSTHPLIHHYSFSHLVFAHHMPFRDATNETSSVVN